MASDAYAITFPKCNQDFLYSFAPRTSVRPEFCCSACHHTEYIYMNLTVRTLQSDPIYLNMYYQMFSHRIALQ